MKVDYISDVHLDFWIREQNSESPKFDKLVNEFINEVICAKGGDVLIIAGDLGHYFAQDSAFLLKLKNMYNHVIVVAGNHDMYLVSKNQQDKYHRNSWNRIDEMKQFCDEHDGLHYLDGNVIDIDGIKFAGLSMSWDKSYINYLRGGLVSDESVIDLFNNVMNDSRLIFQGGGGNYDVSLAYGSYYRVSSFKPLDHFKLEYEKLQNFTKEDQIDVMVSHYSPIFPPNMPLAYAKDENTTFYFFDGNEDVKRISPKYWIFGHTHNKYNFNKHDTKFLCNPLGYPNENTYTFVESFTL